MDLDTAIRVVSPATLFVGTFVGLAGWWTTRRTQLHQNSKAELEILLAAAENSDEDSLYKKFLDDLRKEKLASLAFGCSVPLKEIGALMRYYAHGYATIAQIRLAWPHRTVKNDSLSFRPHGWDRAMLVFGALYSVACLLAGGIFGGAVLLLPPTVSRWQFVPQVACFFVFAAFTFWINRSLFVAQTLAGQETLPSPTGPMLGSS